MPRIIPIILALCLTGCYPVGDPIQTRTIRRATAAADAPPPALSRAFTWDDHRPIGIVQLADDSHRSATNPGSWVLQGSADLDTTTPAGRADFARRVIATANEAVIHLRELNAQGSVTWSLDGGELGTYLGCPDIATRLRPELEPCVDQYFAILRTAGKVGLLLRPEELNLATGKLEQSPDPLQTLLRKAKYARQRWGCKIFYVDTNLWNIPGLKPSDLILPPEMYAQLRKALPGTLWIPEHAVPPGWSINDPSTLYLAVGSYRDAAPYSDMTRGPTPPAVRARVSDAFTCLNVNGSAQRLVDSHAALVAAVKAGDIPLVNVAWDDECIPQVISVMREAMGPATLP